MRENFDFFFQKALDHEGRVYEDVPGDRGGPTKCGVTIGRWAEAQGHRSPGKRGSSLWDELCASLKEASLEEIEVIYRRDYWAAVGADDLPSGVDYCVADFGLNSGPTRAVRYLQASLGLPENGKASIGLAEAVAGQAAVDLIEDYCDRREEFLAAIVTRDASQRKFLKGWLARVKDVRASAKKMAAKQAPSLAPTPMAKAELPEATTKDLAGSRKLALIQWFKGWWAALGLGSAGLTVMDGKGYVDGFVTMFKGHAHLLLILVSAVGIGGGYFLVRWMVQDAQEGRYRPGRG